MKKKLLNPHMYLKACLYPVYVRELGGLALTELYRCEGLLSISCTDPKSSARGGPILIPFFSFFLALKIVLTNAK